MSGRTLRVSVVMCTFNGGRYLPQQLASIRAQSVLPDELLVFDDGSSDSTTEIVAAFAEAAPFVVRVLERPPPAPRGPTPNFDRAIRAATGDVIFLSDQDDRWLAHRIEASLAAIDAGATAVFSDALIIDHLGAPTGQTQWATDGFTDARRRQWERGEAFRVLLRANVVCGATLAFRSELRSTILPIPPRVPHDHWIALVAAAVAGGGGLRPLKDPVLEYRRHRGNVVGPRRRSPVARWRQRPRSAAAAELELVLRLTERVGSRLTAADANALSQKVVHAEHRATLPPSLPERLTRCTRELRAGAYGRYARGLESYIADVMFGHRRGHL